MSGPARRKRQPGGWRFVNNLGHALQVRLLVEDPDTGVALIVDDPATGKRPMTSAPILIGPGESATIKRVVPPANTQEGHVSTPGVAGRTA